MTLPIIFSIQSTWIVHCPIHHVNHGLPWRKVSPQLASEATSSCSPCPLSLSVRCSASLPILGGQGNTICELSINNYQLAASRINGSQSCAGPLYMYSRFLWKRALAVRAANKSGATFFPVYQGKWPASLDFIVDMLLTLDSEYIADRLLTLTEELGPTFIIRFMWEDAVGILSPSCCQEQSFSHRGSERGNRSSPRNPVLSSRYWQPISKTQGLFRVALPSIINVLPLVCQGRRKIRRRN